MDVDEASAREQRQFLLMLERLRGFRGRSVPLPRLIADLEGLLLALEITPEKWREAFNEQWIALEVPYAVALDRLDPLPTLDDVDIADAIDALEALVVERLGT